MLLDALTVTVQTARLSWRRPASDHAGQALRSHRCVLGHAQGGGQDYRAAATVRRIPVADSMGDTDWRATALSGVRGTAESVKLDPKSAEHARGAGPARH